jgi:hypothetical protein
LGIETHRPWVQFISPNYFPVISRVCLSISLPISAKARHVDYPEFCSLQGSPAANHPNRTGSRSRRLVRQRRWLGRSPASNGNRSKHHSNTAALLG